MDIIQVDSISKYNEEHYNHGFYRGIKEAMNIIDEYRNDILIEDIETNSPKSPELDLVNKIYEKLKRIKPT